MKLAPMAILGLLLTLGACAAPPVRLSVNESMPDRYAASGDFARCIDAATALADRYEALDPIRTANARYDAASCAEALGDRETALYEYRLSQQADPAFYLARTAELLAGAPFKEPRIVTAQARAHVTKRVQDQLDAATRMAFAVDATPNPPAAEASFEPPAPASVGRLTPSARVSRAPAEIVVAAARPTPNNFACLRVEGEQIHNQCDQPLLARYCGVASCAAANGRDTPGQTVPGQRTLLLPPGVTQKVGPVGWLVACRISEVVHDGSCRSATSVD